MSTSKLTRREFAIGAGFAALAPFAGPAVAQAAWPDRPVHVIIGFAAGSGADILARWYTGKLEELIKQPVIVENRPGASGNIAMRTAAQSKPDGYTLMFNANSGMVGSRFLFKDLPFDSYKDFAPVALFAQLGFVVVVSPNSPLKSVSELSAKLKAKKDNIYGYTNPTGLLSSELYKQMAGVPAKAISYKTTADAMRDIIDGTLDFMIMDGTFAAGQIRQGQLKALAVTSGKRVPTLPDVPTMQEAGLAGFEFAPWWGCWVPTGTPDAVISKLEAAIHQIAAMPETAKFLETVAAVPLTDGPKEVTARMQAELLRWPPLVKAAGIVPE